MDGAYFVPGHFSPLSRGSFHLFQDDVLAELSQNKSPANHRAQARNHVPLPHPRKANRRRGSNLMGTCAHVSVRGVNVTGDSNPAAARAASIGWRFILNRREITSALAFLPARFLNYLASERTVCQAASVASRPALTAAPWSSSVPGSARQAREAPSKARRPASAALPPAPWAPP